MKRYTVMFIPDDRRRTITLNVPSIIIRSIIAFVVLLTLGGTYLIVHSGTIAARLQLLQHLKSENQRLQDQNRKLDQLRASIQRIEQMNAYFEQLVGEPNRVTPPVAKPAKATKTVTGGTKKALAATSPSPRGQPLAGAKALRVKHTLGSVPYVRPVQGWITRRFGDGGTHRGVDFAAATGTPIRATAPGRVESVRVDEFLGKIVTLRHSQGFATLYGHCDQILVTKDEHVHRGQTIAMVGNTGRSSAPHLHYEISKEGKQVDPLQYIAD